VAISILKPPHGGRFASETAARRLQKQSGHLDPEVVKKSAGASKKLSA
jgi:hypothetical protein